MKKILSFIICIFVSVFLYSDLVITKDVFPYAPIQNIGKTVSSVFGTVSNQSGAISAYRITAAGGYWVVTDHCSKQIDGVYTIGGADVTDRFMKVNWLMGHMFCFLLDKTGSQGYLQLRVNLIGIKSANDIENVNNYNFSNWSGGYPVGWNIIYGNHANAINANNGTPCLYLSTRKTASNDRFLLRSDNVYLDINKEYRFSFWFKTITFNNGVNHSDDIQVQIREVGTGRVFAIDSNRELDRRVYNSSFFIDSIKMNSHKWGRYIGYFKPQSLAVFVEVGCLSTTTIKEELFIDDISIRKTTEQDVYYKKYRR